MPRIARETLLTLEAYAKERPAFRARVLAHKKPRSVQLGEHLTLQFEDELTMRYQIQEMLRTERTFEEAGIRDELEVYNPLVPDGQNWKAHLFVEYEDVEERKRALSQLRGIEECVWVQVAGQPRVVAIADRIGRTPAQVLLRWCVQHGIPVIPKSTHRERIAENADLFSFTLSHEDMTALNALDATGGTDKANESTWW